VKRARALARGASVLVAGVAVCLLLSACLSSITGGKSGGGGGGVSAVHSGSTLGGHHHGNALSHVVLSHAPAGIIAHIGGGRHHAARAHKHKKSGSGTRAKTAKTAKTGSGSKASKGATGSNVSKGLGRTKGSKGSKGASATTTTTAPGGSRSPKTVPRPVPELPSSRR
jgi:hypothetical protein